MEWDFLICRSRFRLKFSRIALLRKQLKMDFKSDLTTNGLISEFLVGILLFFVDVISSRTKNCMIAQVCFIFNEIKSFWWLVWGAFWSVLKMCPFFSPIDFSNVDWWALSMQSNFASYVRVSSSVSSVASVDEITIVSSENYKDCFPSVFCVNCQLMFYAVYFNSCFFSKILMEPFTVPARRWPRCCRIFFCGWRKLKRTWTFWVAFMSWTWCATIV